MSNILTNKAQCSLCGDIIESRSVHDFVRCSCGALAVDGGTAYLKRSGNPHACIELSTYRTPPPEKEDPYAHQ